ncbi:MAG: heparinase II/III family protein [Candidatus Hinthialibacter antarcticus]|nr:heparinase II/III family protein [Candidatus Hinthialibacter antarcticus]
MPCTSWDSIPDPEIDESVLSFIPIFDSNFRSYFQQHIQLSDSPTNKVICEAEQILQGHFTLFSFHQKNVGNPPDWFQNPFTKERAQSGVHWSQLSDFEFGDIKAIWEMGRFSWAFTLARAYAHSQDSKFAECFWRLFEDWLDHNPPNTGVHWKCGQEASFRLIATCFAIRVLRNDAATTSDRLKRWRQFVLATGERIAGNIDYALSQSNNHGISECVGLITAVRLLNQSEFSLRWEQYALKALQHEVDALIYDDGSFAQHSTVYHRLMLNMLVWYVALETQCNKNIHSSILSGGERAVCFLNQMVDSKTGSAPLVGHNDGSNILPLSDCDYLDFRPALQTTAWFFAPNLLLRSGPWDEALYWLSGDSQLHSEREKHARSQNNMHAENGGHNIIHQPNSRLYFHSPAQFKHRPSHADLLHIGIWNKSEPITLEPGTFSYNTKDAFSHSMMDTSCHNTIEIDRSNQMEKVNRFLFLPWAKCCVNIKSDSNIEAVHSGYLNKGILHTRSVNALGNDHWVVTDRVANSNSANIHHYRLHWLLADWPYQYNQEAKTVMLKTPEGSYTIEWKTPGHSPVSTIIRADTNSSQGWWSPYYLHAAPALSLVIEITTNSNVIFETHFYPESRVNQ